MNGPNSDGYYNVEISFPDSARGKTLLYRYRSGNQFDIRRNFKFDKNGPQSLMDRWSYLDGLADDAYDLIIFDCPPAIGYQSMNAVFAADLLYVPSGPGYWEYDSTTSFIGQLSEALGDLAQGYAGTFPAGNMALPKTFTDIRFLMTRFEPGNELHRAMYDAFGKVFGDHLATHPIEMTRAVEQSGRFLSSVYEIDYREMTRETWRRARSSFDRAYVEFKGSVLQGWAKLETTS